MAYDIAVQGFGRVADEYKLNQTAHTRWGDWTITDIQKEAGVIVQCTKNIGVKATSSLSSQGHEYRAEDYTGVKGITTVVVGDKVFDLGPDDTVHIPRGAWHFSLSYKGSRFIEVQTGYGPIGCDEDDIYRGRDVLKKETELNPKYPDLTPRESMLMGRMQVAEMRLAEEGPQHSYHENDFMDKVVDLLDEYPDGFDNGLFKAKLYDMFEQDLEGHLAKHVELTEKCENERRFAAGLTT